MAKQIKKSNKNEIVPPEDSLYMTIPEAKAYLSQSQARYGELSLEAGLCHKDLAHTYTMEMEPDLALAEYAKAVQVFEQLPDLDQYWLARAHMDLSYYHLHQNHPKEALIAAQQAYDVYKPSLQQKAVAEPMIFPDPVETRQHMPQDYLRFLHYGMQDYASCIKLTEWRIMEIAVPSAGEFRAELVQEKQFLGHLMLSNKQFDKGLEQYANSAQLTQHELGKDHPLTQKAIELLGQAYGRVGETLLYKQHNPVQAIAVLDQGKKQLLQSFENTDMRLEKIHKTLGYAHQALDHPKQAFEHFQDLRITYLTNDRPALAQKTLKHMEAIVDQNLSTKLQVKPNLMSITYASS